MRDEALQRIEEFLDRWEAVCPGSETLHAIGGLRLIEGAAVLTVSDLREAVAAARHPEEH